MPTLATPEIIEHVATRGFSEPVMLYKREPTTAFATLQGIVDKEIRSNARAAGWFAWMFHEHRILSTHIFAVNVHPDWFSAEKPLLFGEEPRERPTMLEAIRGWLAAQEDTVLEVSEPTFVDTDEVTTQRKWFAFPPYGEEKLINVQYRQQNWRRLIPETGQELNARFVATIIKFGSAKKDKNPTLRFVQIGNQDEDGNRCGPVQVWNATENRCLGVIMPIARRK